MRKILSKLFPTAFWRAAATTTTGLKYPGSHTFFFQMIDLSPSL